MNKTPQLEIINSCYFLLRVTSELMMMTEEWQCRLDLLKKQVLHVLSQQTFRPSRDSRRTKRKSQYQCDMYVFLRDYMNINSLLLQVEYQLGATNHITCEVAKQVGLLLPVIHIN